MLRNILLYIHIFSVIMSIGPFLVLMLIVKRLREAEGREQNGYVEVFRSAVWLTKHAGHLLVVSGILLVMITPWTWKTPWIVATVVIMFSSLYFVSRAFSPALRKYSKNDEEKAESVNILRRSVWLYVILMMIMMWFMVAKPMLW